MCFSASYAAPKTRRKTETPLETRHETDRNCPNYSINGWEREYFQDNEILVKPDNTASRTVNKGN